MSHEDFENRCLLLLYGELGHEQREELEHHLESCSSCKLIMEGLQQMHRFLDENTEQPPEMLLQDSRQKLFNRLRQENLQKEKNFWISFKESFQLMVKPVPVATLAAALLIGLLLGYLGFNGSGPEWIGSRVLDEPILISEVQFQESDSGDGQVELSFHASRRVSIKGKLDDPEIQRVLAHALIRERNTGVRLQAISAISSRERLASDSEIQSALIAALKTDDNPAVRQQALEALRNSTRTPEVKAAFIHVLRYDGNVRLRIEAVNALQDQLGSESDRGEDIRNAFEERMRKDNNLFIRNQAKAALQKAGYQHF